MAIGLVLNKDRKIIMPMWGVSGFPLTLNDPYQSSGVNWYGSSVNEIISGVTFRDVLKFFDSIYDGSTSKYYESSVNVPPPFTNSSNTTIPGTIMIDGQTTPGKTSYRTSELIEGNILGVVTNRTINSISGHIQTKGIEYTFTGPGTNLTGVAVSLLYQAEWWEPLDKSAPPVVIDTKFSYSSTSSLDNKSYRIRGSRITYQNPSPIADTNLYYEVFGYGEEPTLSNVADLPTEWVSGPPGPTSKPNEGNGDFDNSTDPIPLPDKPLFNAVNTGFVTMFTPSQEELEQFSNYMFNPDIWESLSKLFANPIDYILGLYYIPIKPEVYQNKVFVFLGNINSNVQMSVPKEQYIDVDCGTISITEYFGGFTDYSPYTSIKLYLPYIGEVTLDPDEVMNSTLRVVYRIDIYTGSLIAYIIVNGNVSYQFNGNCSIQLPITSIDYNNIISTGVGIALGAGGALLTGGATLPLGAAIAMGARGSSTFSAEVNSRELSQQEIATHGVNEVMQNTATTAGGIITSKPAISRTGSITNQSAILGVQYPFLTITSPRQCLPENAKSYTGRPSNITVKLGDLTGFTTVRQIHLNGFEGATEQELIEIDRMLREGVIF